MGFNLFESRNIQLCWSVLLVVQSFRIVSDLIGIKSFLQTYRHSPTHQPQYGSRWDKHERQSFFCSQASTGILEIYKKMEEASESVKMQKTLNVIAVVINKSYWWWYSWQLLDYSNVEQEHQWVTELDTGQAYPDTIFWPLSIGQ